MDPIPEKFFYQSPNGQIEGYKCRARQQENRPVIFCRGGNRDFGQIDEFVLETFFIPLAKAGLSVYGTQYSGGPNSDGKDEFGGKDVVDVLALLEVVKKDGLYQEGGFLGLVGFSRGAIDGCRALQQGLPVTHAAFVGGSFDLRNIEHERPDLFEMLKKDQLFDVNEITLRERSALAFADELPQIPFLLMHSEEDERVPVRQAVEMAQVLGQRATLKLFPGDDHGLIERQNERNHILIDWFMRS